MDDRTFCTDNDIQCFFYTDHIDNCLKLKLKINDIALHDKSSQSYEASLAVMVPRIISKRTRCQKKNMVNTSGF